MGPRDHHHDSRVDKLPPMWATVSWLLAASAFVVLAVGLVGWLQVPYFPAIAFGLFVLAVVARIRNDRMYRRRHSQA